MSRKETILAELKSAKVYGRGRTINNLAWLLGNGDVNAPTPSVRRSIGELRKLGYKIIYRNGFYKLTS